MRTGMLPSTSNNTALNQTKVIRHATALSGLSAASYSESALQSLVRTSSADRTLTKQFDGLGRLTREYSQASGYNAATNSSYASKYRNHLSVRWLWCCGAGASSH